jgi:16S rRNA processing protein RimM
VLHTSTGSRPDLKWATRAMSGTIAIGRFGRPHGVRGQIRFWPFNPETKMVKTGNVAMVGPHGTRTQAMQLTTVRRDAKSFVVAFDGISDRDEINAINGHQWFVGREDFPAAGHDEVYFADLMGAPVTTSEGVVLGTLVDIRDAGPAELLVIRRNGKELLVPNVELFVERLRSDGIVIRPIDGLLEI